MLKPVDGIRHKEYRCNLVVVETGELYGQIDISTCKAEGGGVQSRTFMLCGLPDYKLAGQRMPAHCNDELGSVRRVSIPSAGSD